jgi:hypothetical protein
MNLTGKEWYVPKGILVVQSGPADPSRRDEYNDWYTNIHIPDMLAGPGFVSARRYRRLDQTDNYLAIYELAADDLTEPLAARQERRAQGLTAPTSDALATDPPATMTIYELLE